MHQELASSILGLDFVSPLEVMESSLGVVYTRDQLSWFSNNVPTKERLDWCSRNGYTLVPGPNSQSFMEMYDLFPRDVVEDKWIMIRKGAVPRSTFCSWTEQQRLLLDTEFTPSITDVMWCMMVHREIRKNMLFSDLQVRTASTYSLARRYIIGFQDGLISVCYNWDDRRFDKVGLASALKP